MATSPIPPQAPARCSSSSRFRASRPRSSSSRIHLPLISAWSLAKRHRPAGGCGFGSSTISFASHDPIGSREWKLGDIPIRCTIRSNQTPESDVCLCIGAHLVPHPNKIDKGGEDAYFVSAYNGGGVIGIADGVSGWAEQNVDPSLFSRELMTTASSLLTAEEVSYDPQILLREAHAATSSVGSATVIIAMFARGGILKIANLGDCGLRVIREGKVVFSTSPQEHYFDCPYQLSSEVVGQTYLDAVVSTVQLMEQDTIVMGSDGLFDNVFDHEIVSIVTRYSNVSDTAKALCDVASMHSADSSFDSPYSVEARARVMLVLLQPK